MKLASLTTLFLLACHADKPTNAIEASHVSQVCERACARLRDLGCPEADDPGEDGITCEALCSKLEEQRKFSLKPRCVAAATTREQARACGSVRCEVDQ